MNTNIPTKIKQTTKGNPWVTREIIHTERKIKTQKIKRLGKVLSKKEQITNLSKELGRKIKCAKKNFYNETIYFIIRTAPDKFWRYINLRAKVSNDTAIVSSPDKADPFDDYVHSVFTRDNSVVPPNINIKLLITNI